MKALHLVTFVLLTTIIWLTVHQYFFCPRFSFDDPKPFHGQHWYNPYQNIDSSAWAMCNFHAHSSSWGGLTNGKGTPDEVWKTYDSLGYSVHLVSNYQKIDYSHEFEVNFIPSYEHGFNINKVHHLVLGDQVNWLDYIFPQILSNKQWVLNQLSQNKENLVILNHPDMRNGIEFTDVKYLSNYRCMEILSPYSYALAKWDSTLSAGKAVFLIGSDDVHNIFDRQSIGKFCTVVNSQIPSKEHVLNSLKTGSSYGMKISEITGESFLQKVERFKTKLPHLMKCLLKDSTILLTFDKTAREITFIGNNGRVLKKQNQAYKASYKLNKSDQYVRITVIYEDGTTIFLNPIFRYSETPFNTYPPPINFIKTKLLNSVGILILLVWIYVVYHFTANKYQNPWAHHLPKRLPNPQRG